MNSIRFGIVLTSFFANAYLAAGISSHCPQDQLCLTSFKQCDDDWDEACRPPPGPYPWLALDDSAQLPALLGGTNYTISWEFGANAQLDIPVRIQWLMDFIVWERNTTELEYTFDPGEILSCFPTPQAPNMLPAAAWFNASQQSANMFIISQPGAAEMGSSFPLALSQHFTVLPRVVKDYVDTQTAISRQIEYNKWKMGVSIGLGIGIPVLVIATTLGILAAAKRQSKDQVDEGVVETAHNEGAIF
ncbi:hypothetical protein F4808DRAFT_456522 [Astrocystis sublimbata]|nr:hypothetical protein F4808DRAFT_456522 [Astrocystis sublimbata]